MSTFIKMNNGPVTLLMDVNNKELIESKMEDGFNPVMCEDETVDVITSEDIATADTSDVGVLISSAISKASKLGVVNNANDVNTVNGVNNINNEDIIAAAGVANDKVVNNNVEVKSVDTTVKENTTKDKK